MPEFYPTHGAVFARVLMEDLAQQGIPPHVLLEGTGITQSALMVEGAELPYDQIAAVFERAADLTGDSLLGLHRGQTRRSQRAGALAYVGLAAPTVKDLIINMARFSRVFSDATVFSLDDLDSKNTMAWNSLVPSWVKRRQFNEFATAGLITALRQWTGQAISPTLLTFKHARNSGLDEFEAFLGGPVQFGAVDNTITYSDEDLECPLITADEDLLEVLQKHCEAVLSQKKARTSGLVFQLERSISQRLTAGNAKQDIVAADLGLSRRSLSRHLSQEGTSFNTVLDNLRASLSESYLSDKKLPLSEIAFLLGYSSLSGFNSAHRRWTGQSPGQARQNLNSI